VILGYGGMSRSCAGGLLEVRGVGSKRHKRSFREVILLVMRILVLMVGCHFVGMNLDTGIICIWWDHTHT